MPTLLMKRLRLKGHYSCVSCEATTHPGEEVRSSFCDSQGGASFWGVAAAGVEGPEEAAVETESRKVLSKLWPDFIELIHGYGCHSCAKMNLFFCHRLGIMCAHVCVDTGVPWFCDVSHPPTPNTHISLWTMYIAINHRRSPRTPGFKLGAEERIWHQERGERLF